MPSDVSHDRHNIRRFAGELDGSAILTCLNLEFSDERFRELAPAVRRRVFLFLQRIRKIEAKIRENRLSGKELHAELTGVNRALRSYPMYQFLFPDQTKASGWKVHTGYSAADDSGIIGAHSFGKPTTQQERLMNAAEASAVHGIVRLSDAGLLDRLRTCACGRWYFARFSHQNFCSTDCRVKFWEGSEPRREQKRQRARENYLYKKAHSTSVKKGR